GLEQVKCDERPNGCFNCEKLQLSCLPASQGTSNESNPVSREEINNVRVTARTKRKRTYRSCISCRESKVKCSGDRPTCSKCWQKAAICVYDAEPEPVWVQSIAPLTSHAPIHETNSSQARLPASHGVPSSPAVINENSSISWLRARELPPKPRLTKLVEAFFSNVHPIRIFAFIHKPSFMKSLDLGQLSGNEEQALLHIICALGARFYALEYHESVSTLPRELIQSAGNQWAKAAEELIFAEYSAISITRLMVLALLHDYEARLGNYAQSFMLTGLITRMSHALQINLEQSTDLFCRESSNPSADVTLKESRRRLMWACYMVDVWAGSGVDQLTLLNEADIKLQLPCNERNFLLQIPCVTECLQAHRVLDFISPQDIPVKPGENMGISAYYIRIVNIWQKVLRFVKHLDEVQPPWLPNSEFILLYQRITAWRENLPSVLEWNPDNIYVRRESSQLGALFLLHIMCHHVICDLYRISFPELFKIREAFPFPPEQQPFVSHLQLVCFENAQRIAILFFTTLQHGAKYLADPILPSFAYNSSRVMLYYLARILDRSKPEARNVIKETMDLIRSNNKSLQAMAMMYPLAEPLYITADRWLDKVRRSFTRIDMTAYLGPQDPSDLNEVESPQEVRYA
ncbi:uncharacterized protein BDR25DRAFT_381369, partial [Lindgomyces ingoldianus]